MATLSVDAQNAAKDAQRKKPKRRRQARDHEKKMSAKY
jgi:hypothetical protein